MKKHVEFHHFFLLKKLLEDGANFAIKLSLNYEWVVKKKRMYFPMLNLVAFLLQVCFKKVMQPKWVVCKVSCCLW